MNQVVHARFALPLVLLAGACRGETQSAPPSMPASAPPIETASAMPPAPTTSAEPPPPPKPPLAELQKNAILSRVAAFNAHDAKKLAAAYSDDAIVAMPAPEGWKTDTRDGFEKMHVGLFAGVPDSAMGVSRVFVKGDQAVLEWVATGTDSAGEKPSGKKIGFRAASVLWFNAEGLIRQDHTYIDYATIAMQAGKMPGQPRALAALPSGEPRWIVAAGSEDALVESAKNAWPASWPKHDKKAYGASLTDDFVHEEIASPNDVSGRSQAMMEFDVYDKAVPDMAVSVDNAWAAGSFVVMEFTFRGTQKSALGPIKSTGKPFTIHGLDIDAMTGGDPIRMQKATTYTNSVEYLTQLGAMPAKKSDEAKQALKAASKPAAKPVAKSVAKPRKGDKK